MGITSSTRESGEQDQSLRMARSSLNIVFRGIQQSSTDSSVIRFLNQEFVQFSVPESESSIELSPVAYDKDIYGGATLYSMMRNHSGEVFDLLIAILDEKDRPCIRSSPVEISMLDT